MIYPYLYKDKLQSERLSTRFLTIQDAEAWSSFFEDTYGTRFLLTGGITNNVERAQAWIEKQLGRYEQLQFGLQALVEIQTGELVGQCGLLEQEIDGVVELEVGYHLFQKHRNRGFATEAARLFRDYAFTNLQVNSVVSMIHPENYDSQAVATRNGMTLTSRCIKFDMDVLIYRIYRPHWENLMPGIK